MFADFSGFSAEAQSALTAPEGAVGDRGTCDTGGLAGFLIQPIVTVAFDANANRHSRE